MYNRNYPVVSRERYRAILVVVIIVVLTLFLADYMVTASKNIPGPHDDALSVESN